MKKKTVGFFGGSFDPIHFGHLNLAVQLLESYHLDEILFCPVFCSPFKTATPPIASPADRLAMLHLALDHPQFKITPHELDHPGPSYTIDTLRALQVPHTQFHLLLSEEAAIHLNKWKESQELLRLAPPLIAAREFPISSTEIRSRLQKKLYCGHLVPAKALEYIHKQRLY